MKIIKPHYDLLLYFFIPFCLITTGLYFFRFQQIAEFASANWLFSLLLLIFFFLPFGSSKLGVTPYLKTNKWACYLLLSNLLMNLTVWSVSKIVTLNLNNLAVQKMSLSDLSLAYGLFPWGFMCLSALTLGFFIYGQKKIGLLSSTYQPLFKNNHLDSVGIAVDSYMRSLPTCILVAVLSLMAYALVFLLSKYLQLDVVMGLRFQIIFTSSVLLFLIAQPSWNRFLHLASYHKVPTVIILLGFIGLLGLLSILLIVISNGLIAINPLLDSEFFAGNSNYQDQHILITITFFWYGLAALNSAYIALISQGRSIRQTILFSLITFCISLALIALLENGLKGAYETLPLYLILICGSLITLIMTSKHYFTYFTRATLPSELPTKPRPTFRFLKIVPFIVVTVFCIYFALGVRVWSFLIVLGLLPPIVIIWIGFSSFAARAFRTKRTL
jgi:hypothetical protein